MKTRRASFIAVVAPPSGAVSGPARTRLEGKNSRRRDASGRSHQRQLSGDSIPINRHSRKRVRTVWLDSRKDVSQRQTLLSFRAYSVQAASFFFS